MNLHWLIFIVSLCNSGLAWVVLKVSPPILFSKAEFNTLIPFEFAILPLLFIRPLFSLKTIFSIVTFLFSKKLKAPLPYTEYLSPFPCWMIMFLMEKLLAL